MKKIHTPINSFIQSFSRYPTWNICLLFDIFDKMPDINGTQYRIYHLQRPNAGLHQMKYLNLEITSNMRLTPPHLDQSANYDATAHNTLQINNSLYYLLIVINTD